MYGSRNFSNIYSRGRSGRPIFLMEISQEEIIARPVEAYNLGTFLTDFNTQLVYFVNAKVALLLRSTEIQL